MKVYVSRKKVQNNNSLEKGAPHQRQSLPVEDRRPGVFQMRVLQEMVEQNSRSQKAPQRQESSDTNILQQKQKAEMFADVSGSVSAPVQRTPKDWKESAELKAIMRIESGYFSTAWKQIKEKVEAYGKLGENVENKERKKILSELATLVRTWIEIHPDSDKDSRILSIYFSLNTLIKMIVQEMKELGLVEDEVSDDNKGLIKLIKDKPKEIPEEKKKSIMMEDEVSDDSEGLIKLIKNKPEEIPEEKKKSVMVWDEVSDDGEGLIKLMKNKPKEIPEKKKKKGMVEDEVSDDEGLIKLIKGEPEEISGEKKEGKKKEKDVPRKGRTYVNSSGDRLEIYPEGEQFKASYRGKAGDSDDSFLSFSTELGAVSLTYMMANPKLAGIGTALIATAAKHFLEMGFAKSTLAETSPDSIHLANILISAGILPDQRRKNEESESGNGYKGDNERSTVKKLAGIMGGGGNDLGKLPRALRETKHLPTDILQERYFDLKKVSDVFNSKFKAKWKANRI